MRGAVGPEKKSQAGYPRLQTERRREAAGFRGQGSEKSQEIRSRADREVTVLVAEATSKAEQIRGDGDAELAGHVIVTGARQAPRVDLRRMCIVALRRLKARHRRDSFKHPTHTVQAHT